MAHTAVIAGTGARIVESVAQRFAEEGCPIGLFARSEDYLTKLASELSEKTDGEAIAVPTDITDPAQVEAGFDEVREAFDPIEILLNNAYPTCDTESDLSESNGGPLGAGRSAFERS